MGENVGETPHIGVRGGSRIIDDDDVRQRQFLMFGVIELCAIKRHQAISSATVMKSR